MKKLKTLSEFWIPTYLEKPSQKKEGNVVSYIMPTIYESYCKLFHPIYIDCSIEDKKLTWDSFEKNEVLFSNEEKIINSTVLVNKSLRETEQSKRVLWRNLAKQYDLHFHKELNSHTFTSNFPGQSWPRYLFGPQEGSLDFDICKAVIDMLTPFTGDMDCFFYYVFYATDFSVETTEDLLYQAKLKDVLDFFLNPKVYGTPTYWWSRDRSWCICSDWDLPFTVIGGSRELINSIIASQSLECIEVDLNTRIDYESDRVNSIS